MKKAASHAGSTYTTASCNLSIAWIKELNHLTMHSPQNVPLATINNSCSHLGPAAMSNLLGDPLLTHALACTVKWFMEFTEVYRGEVSMLYRGEVSMLYRGEVSMLYRGEVSVLYRGEVSMLHRGEVSMLYRGEVCRGEVSMLYRGEVSMLYRGEVSMLYRGEVSMLYRGEVSMLLHTARASR